MVLVTNNENAPNYFCVVKREKLRRKDLWPFKGGVGVSSPDYRFLCIWATYSLLSSLYPSLPPFLAPSLPLSVI